MRPARGAHAWGPFVTNNQASPSGAPDGWTFADLDRLAQVNPEQLASGTDPNYLLEYVDIGAIERPGIIGPSRTYRFADAPSRARRIVPRRPKQRSAKPSLPSRG